jgi:CxxC motif-containing protein
VKKEIICIVCPVGCTLEVTVEDGKLVEVTGYECKRGVAYAEQEAVAPKRTLATTVRVKNGIHPLVPVKTDIPVPKEKMREITELLAQVEVEAPVKIGSIIVADVLGTGANVVATRNLPAREDSIAG